MPRALLELDLTRQELRTFIALGLFANGRGQATVAENTLMRLLDVRWRSSVRDAVDGLARKGALLVNRGGHGRPTAYQLVLPVVGGQSDNPKGSVVGGQSDNPGALQLSGFPGEVVGRPPGMNREQSTTTSLVEPEGWPQPGRRILRSQLVNLGASQAEATEVARRLLDPYRAGRLRLSRELVAAEIAAVRELDGREDPEFKRQREEAAWAEVTRVLRQDPALADHAESLVRSCRDIGCPPTVAAVLQEAPHLLPREAANPAATLTDVAVEGSGP